MKVFIVDVVGIVAGLNGQPFVEQGSVWGVTPRGGLKAE